MKVSITVSKVTRVPPTRITPPASVARGIGSKAAAFNMGSDYQIWRHHALPAPRKRINAVVQSRGVEHARVRGVQDQLPHGAGQAVAQRLEGPSAVAAQVDATAVGG